MSPAPPERWLPVAGFPHYEVSDLGRIRSIDRVIPCWNRWGGIRLRHYRGRVLRLATNIHGYRTAVIYRDQVPHTLSVHVLVAEAFLGPRPDGMEVCHGPNGKLDNRPPELRYDTPAGNQADRLRDGTDNRGSKNAQVKLTEAEVVDIRSRVGAGLVSQAALAREYHVSAATICLIVKRKLWPHIALRLIHITLVLQISVQVIHELNQIIYVSALPGGPG